MGDHTGRLLVDARPIEHPTARRRGIGRYTAGFLGGLAEIGVPVTALATDEAEAAIIAADLPTVEVVPWSRSVVREHAHDGTWYVATGLFLHPVSFDPIPSTITEAGLPVASVMYDVIPYRYPEKYLANPSARRMHELRKPLARTVDLHLAISEFAARTAVDVLGLDPRRMYCIGAGVEARFHRPSYYPHARPDTVPEGRYVVCVTGADEHKNTIGLIAAWGLVDDAVRAGRQLVIVGGASDEVIAAWQTAAERAGVASSIMFTGAVSDDLLVQLLQHASLSVTPSLEEGFGLPVLEAVACGCPAITSDRGALPEVLDEPTSLFDPSEPASIAAAITLALVDDHHRHTIIDAGRKAVARWRWSLVALAAIEAIYDTAPVSTRGIRPLPRRTLVIAHSAEPLADAEADRINAADPSADVWVAVDVTGTDASSRPTARRSPAGAVGRFPKRHDFDGVVAVSRTS